MSKYQKQRREYLLWQISPHRVWQDLETLCRNLLGWQCKRGRIRWAERCRSESVGRWVLLSGRWDPIGVTQRFADHDPMFNEAATLPTHGEISGWFRSTHRVPGMPEISIRPQNSRQTLEQFIYTILLFLRRFSSSTRPRTGENVGVNQEQCPYMASEKT